MVRYGRQTVSVDVDSGVLLFDRKAGSFGIERVSHDRSKKLFTFQCLQRFSCLQNIYCVMFFVYQSFRLSNSRAVQPKCAWWLTATTTHHGR